MPHHLTDRLNRVLRHIHDTPAGDLSLDRLADLAAMSRFHWHRVFRGLTGETVAGAVRRIRLERAAMELIHSAAPVSRTATETGYPNAASFTRAFKAHFGTSPTAFRARGTAPTPHHPSMDPPMTQYPIEITTRPALRLAALPHSGDYLRIGATFERLFALFAAEGWLAMTTGSVGIYYDNPAETPATDLRSDAAMIVPEDFPITPPLRDIRLPANRTAVLHHQGPYATLPAAYDQIFCNWLPASGEEPGDIPAYEIYLNNPRDTAPEALRTDICIALKTP